MEQITNEFLQRVAGTIEGLLLENQTSISAAYLRTDGVKLNLGIDMDPSSKGVVVNYALSFRIEPAAPAPLKETIKKKETIDPNQVELFKQ